MSGTESGTFLLNSIQRENLDQVYAFAPCVAATAKPGVGSALRTLPPHRGW